MDFGRENTESSFEDLESEAASLKERGDELEQRESQLGDALTKLEADTAVTKSLEANEQELESQKEKLEGERTDALASLAAISEALEQLEEANNHSDASLDQLRELGEDVSDAESVIDSRRRWLEECYARVEHLYEVLGEDYEKIGNLSDRNGKGVRETSDADAEKDENVPLLFKALGLDAYLRVTTPTTPPAKTRPESSRSSREEVTRKIPGFRETTQRFEKLPNGNSRFNSPDSTGRNLNYSQGNAVWSFRGTCGLCSCENIARLAGKDITEADVIDLACNNMWCVQGTNKPGSNGGTHAEGRQSILAALGIESVLDDDRSLDHIAAEIEAGKGVVASVKVREFWPNYPYKGNHAVTLTSVERNSSGKIVAFYVCDSGSRAPDFARRVEVDRFKMSLNLRPLNVTTRPIR